MEYINLQLSTFLILLITGMLMGVLFDLYRVLRSRLRPNVIVDFLGDLFFWLVALFGVGLLVYWGTWLELRLYVWLILLGGLLFYYLWFSALLIPWYLRFWQAIGWLPRQLTGSVWRFSVLIKKMGWRRQKPDTGHSSPEQKKTGP
jgi:spore cortex biosynthesis protein YabQ